MYDKKILITGGAGYIGSVLTKKLKEKNYKIRILDCLLFGKEHLSNIITPEDEIIKLDIQDIEKHPEVFDGIESVVHLAALSNDPSCELDPEYTKAVNIEATKKVINLSKKNGIKRFIFSSSCSVYGASESEEMDEESLRNPVSLYAKSKIEIENFLLNLNDETFSPIILRNGTIFGYSPKMRTDLIVNTMTKSALTNGVIKIFGDGKNWRPNIHVNDVCDAFILALESPIEKVAGEIFNIGSNELNYTVEEIAKIISEITKTKIEYIIANIDIRSYKVNFDKVYNKLGFKAKIKIEEGVKEIIEKIKNKSFDIEDKRNINMEIMKILDQLPKKDGGIITRKNPLLFNLPLIGSDEIKEIIDTIQTGYLMRGSKTNLFEEEIKNYCHVKYCHALNSCSAALHLSLIAMGIKEGDEVVTSPITFESVAHIIINEKAIPKFVDVEIDTANIDPKKIEEKITPKTVAIITTDISGQPCNYKEIKKLAQKYNLKIIENAAHAIGAEYEEYKIGSITDITCFSFYPTKNITTGGGGAITTNNKEYYEKIKSYTFNYMDNNTFNVMEENLDYYKLPVDYNINDLQSSIGLHQIKKLDSFIDIRQKYAKLYETVLNDLPGIITTKKINNIKHAYNFYIIILDIEKLKIDRDQFLEYLKAENIDARIGFTSLHRHPYYKNKYNLKDKDYPNASYLSDRMLCLPLYPGMTEKDVRDVIKAIKKIIGTNIKNGY